MITLPAPLEKVMQSQDLKGLKPFAVLFRNKWDSVNNKFELEPNPIDISDMIAKPNTLSMTLDVSEIAQYNANNITLTLTDKDNRFVEGTPKSYFPSGYQLYGSKVILYYGLDVGNWTSLFVGVIKDLPTHKPEQYQVDLKLISPLELLKDIEAKDFSDKYTGEALTFVEVDDDGHYVYHTANTGVGGFSAVYADGNKLFEGIDYEISQTNALGLPAIITIIKSDYYSSTITADYYCWKTGLSVEQIVSGLVALGGYTSNTDIRSVNWVNGSEGNTPLNFSDVSYAIGYYFENENFNFNWFDISSWDNFQISNKGIMRKSIFPSEFTINFNMAFESKPGAWQGSTAAYCIGDELGGANWPRNGYIIIQDHLTSRLRVIKFENNTISNPTTGVDVSGYMSYSGLAGVQVKNGNITFLRVGGGTFGTYPLFFTPAWEQFVALYSDTRATVSGMKFSPNTDNYIISNEAEQYSVPVLKTKPLYFADGFYATLEADDNARYSLKYSFSDDGETFSDLANVDINTNLGINRRYVYFAFTITTPPPFGINIIEPSYYYNIVILVLRLVNLSGKSVLEVLQDLALISGYEFGVDRNGIFFFRPRSQSTTPIFDLDESEIVKIENVKQNFNDFFTKLTLTFAQIPLEFYANTGTRPTPVDKYGIINKEIDKPDIVNYDNPELAQAIGPQLLAIYSDLSDVIQCTAKLNLSLELGDIVNLKRNYNLNTADSATDYTKWQNQNTYFRACKITGINYNLSKRQMTYTLRDVSNENTRPQEEMYEFVYDFPIRLEPKY